MSAELRPDEGVERLGVGIDSFSLLPYLPRLVVRGIASGHDTDAVRSSYFGNAGDRVLESTGSLCRDMHEDPGMGGSAAMRKSLVHRLHVDRAGWLDLKGGDLEVLTGNVDEGPNLDAHNVRPRPRSSRRTTTSMSGNFDRKRLSPTVPGPVAGKDGSHWVIQVAFAFKGGLELLRRLGKLGGHRHNIVTGRGKDSADRAASAATKRDYSGVNEGVTGVKVTVLVPLPSQGPLQRRVAARATVSGQFGEQGVRVLA